MILRVFAKQKAKHPPTTAHPYLSLPENAEYHSTLHKFAPHMDLAVVLSFLRELAANNNKPWMDAHRTEYQRARANFTELVQAVLRGLQQFEPELAGLTAAASQYRINKNDRFQQSDEPYKKRMGAGFARDGRHSPWAGYFLAVQPGGETWVGAGK